MSKRPPSPAASSVASAGVSPAAARSVSGSSTGRSKQRGGNKSATRFEGMSVNEVINFVEKQHMPWDSAMKEMARVETKAKQSMSDTRSNASTVSCYSVAKSVASNATSASRKGRLGMLPLRGDVRPAVGGGTCNGQELSGLMTVHSASSARSPAAVERPPVPGANVPPLAPPSSSSGQTPPRFHHQFAATNTNQQQQQPHSAGLTRSVIQSQQQQQQQQQKEVSRRATGLNTRTASANSNGSRTSQGSNRSGTQLHQRSLNTTAKAGRSYVNKNASGGGQHQGNNASRSAGPDLSLAVTGASTFTFVQPQQQQQQQHGALNLPQLQGIAPPTGPPAMQAARPSSLRSRGGRK